MFSTNLKRSVATLGVVAGLLAAAVPASAQMVDGPVMAKAGPQPHPFTVDPQDGATRGTTAETGFMDYTDDALGFSADAYVNEMGVTAAGDDRGQNAGTKAPSTSGRPQGVIWDLLEQANAGTQVGSEGAFTEGNGQPCCDDIEYP